MKTKKTVTRKDLEKLIALIRGEEYALLNGMPKSKHAHTLEAVDLMAKAERDELTRLLEAKL